ncbi:AraC family transcriptional regulator [Cohnella silvisoli]|uniref:AraC family transcriptional regulator n=1 Tax=Cohnella silvisoli TaxID=2873699 RepID=A0ABV1L0P3_9BACL|nr:AraC family transcriptional regulator [Cohnella silvisoli]MCD9025063.1 AraC family transcriptional regulator [Cohnella silvisoli]
MTIYPMNKDLSDYEMIAQDFPFYISINEVRHTFPAHRHDFLECSLVIEGEGHETINGVKHPMTRGTFTLLLPYQVHEIVTTSPTPLRLFNCMFAMELLVSSTNNGSPYLQSLLTENQQPYLHIENQFLIPIENLLHDMVQEYNQSHPFRNELLTLKLHEILMRFQRTRLSKQGTELHDRAYISGNGSIWPVIEYIHYHYRDDLSLSGLSQHFHIHPSRLSVEIKKHAGINFLHLLHKIRLRHACGLLSATDMSILDIALEVGFSSYNVFARLFREYKGVTPSDYRYTNSLHKRNKLHHHNQLTTF